MATERPGDRCWQLKPNIVFVDAHDMDQAHKPRKPDDHAFPHLVINVNQPPPKRKVIKLGEGAGFIMRFIVMGMDCANVIPQILVSEFNLSLEQARGEVSQVESAVAAYLTPRAFTRPHDTDFTATPISGKPGHYNLDFGVHSYGGGFIKGPF